MGFLIIAYFFKEGCHKGPTRHKQLLVPKLPLKPTLPLTLCLDIRNVLRNQRVEIARPIVNRIPIIRRLPTAQCIPVLPVHITCNACRAQRCSLPWPFNSCFVSGNAIFFQDTRLADFNADSAVVGDPGRTPGCRFAPCTC